MSLSTAFGPGNQDRDSTLTRLKTLGSSKSDTQRFLVSEHCHLVCAVVVRQDAWDAHS